MGAERVTTVRRRRMMPLRCRDGCERCTVHMGRGLMIFIPQAIISPGPAHGEELCSHSECGGDI